MTVMSLDHYTVCTTDLERSRRFFEEVVGLTGGDRPPFDFPGLWLYAGDGTPVLHLVGIGAQDARVASGGGAIDHIAFMCRDYPQMRQKFERLGIPFEENIVPLTAMRQLFIRDPEGIKLELNFPA
jgi:catechol 2,3-dioxygenase-like lactoylglutathione lyase family enzyme